MHSAPKNRLHNCHKPSGLVRPPPPRLEPEWRPLRPLEESDVIEFHPEVPQDSEHNPAIVPQHLRLRPLDQLREREENEGGGQGGEEEQPVEEEGQVVHERLPLLIHGPRPRRRPPREQQLAARDQGEGDVAQEQADQPPLIVQEVQAQMEDPTITRGGRRTKKPDRYGMEEERGQEQGEDMILRLSPPPSREITPFSSANTSPETSLNQRPLARDVLERHRHFSVEPGELNRGRNYCMIDWIPHNHANWRSTPISPSSWVPYNQPDWRPPPPSRARGRSGSC